MNPRSSMLRALHLAVMLAALLWLASPATAQYVSRDEAIRIARREVKNQLGVSWSDVQVQEVSESRRGYTVNWSAPGRHGRLRTGWCVVSRRGSIVEFQRNSRQDGQGGDEPPDMPRPDQGGAPGSRVSLRGPNGQYVFAEGATGTVMCRGNRGGEALGLFDHNGGSLQNGDPISLRSERGGWLSAENGGGGNLVTGGNSAGPWETFTIVKLDLSSGPAIRSGDRVALRSHGGRFITAENGGGSKLNCKGTSQGPWEVFIIEFR